MDMQTKPIVATLALALGISTALAAPIGMRAPVGTQAPATRSLAPAAAPGTAAAPTPAALRADLVVENNGVYIGGRLATFGGTTGIVSTAMAQPAPAQRGRERVPSCSFSGSFTIGNAGGGPAGAVDVYTWLEQPQGPQVGKISNQGYGNPALAPGGRQTWSFGFTVAQGSYVLHLVIDPKHLNKQNAVNLKASCGYGGISQMRAPAALAPAHLSGGVAPSGGIGIARTGMRSFRLVEGVAGESGDLAHRGWIELLSASWRNEGPDGSRAGCQRIRFVGAKLVDKSSPQLAGLAVSGRPTAITVDGPGGRRTLQRAMITSVTPSGGGNRPQESLSATGSSCR
jgi:hypothetical protein